MLAGGTHPTLGAAPLGHYHVFCHTWGPLGPNSQIAPVASWESHRFPRESFLKNPSGNWRGAWPRIVVPGGKPEWAALGVGRVWQAQPPFDRLAKARQSRLGSQRWSRRATCRCYRCRTRSRKGKQSGVCTIKDFLKCQDWHAISPSTPNPSCTSQVERTREEIFIFQVNPQNNGAMHPLCKLQACLIEGCLRISNEAKLASNCTHPKCFDCGVTER